MPAGAFAPAPIKAACLVSQTTIANGCPPPPLIFRFGGGIVPKQLPKDDWHPFPSSCGANISNQNGTEPAPLKEMNHRLPTMTEPSIFPGIPACNPKIQLHDAS